MKTMKEGRIKTVNRISHKSKESTGKKEKTKQNTKKKGKRKYPEKRPQKAEENLNFIEQYKLKPISANECKTRQKKREN
jgi:hypothetical protein